MSNNTLNYDLWKCLETSVIHYPNAPFYKKEKKTYTYVESYNRIKSCCLYLKQYRSKYIVVLLPNCSEYLEINFISVGLRKILVNIHFKYSFKQICNIIDSLGDECHIIFTNNTFKDVIERYKKNKLIITTFEKITVNNGKEFVPIALDYPNRVCQIFYTSGTSSNRPKGVLITYKNIMTQIRNSIERMDIQQERWLHFSPMCHVGDAWAIFAITMKAGCHFCVSNFDIVKSIDIIENEEITMIKVVPTTLRLFLTMQNNFNNSDNSKSCFSSIRVAVCGGEPLSKDLLSTCIQVFPFEIIHIYGLTESYTNLFISYYYGEKYNDNKVNEELLEEKVTCGKPIKCCQVKILDENNKECNTGDVGEIVVSSDTIRLGYFGKPIDKSEWFYTGDLGKKDINGNYTILGRKKDLIIVAGENVYPKDVEQILLSYPTIKNAAVYGISHKIFGQVVKAAIILKDEKVFNRDDIDFYCRQYLAKFAIPVDYTVLKEFPQGYTGKTLKFELIKSDIEHIIYQLKENPDDSKIIEFLTFLIKKYFGITVSSTISFITLGLDSIDCIQLQKLINNKLNININIDNFFKENSIYLIVNEIKVCLNNKSKDESNDESKDESKDESNDKSNDESNNYIRELKGSEIQFYRYNWYCKSFINLKSIISFEKIKKALEIVKQRHILLQSCIIKKDGKYYFSKSEKTIELIQLDNETEIFNLNEYIPHNKYLFHVIYTIRQEKTILVFYIHHSIWDGKCQLIKELLTICKNNSMNNSNYNVVNKFEKEGIYHLNYNNNNSVNSLSIVKKMIWFMVNILVVIINNIIVDRNIFNYDKIIIKHENYICSKKSTIKILQKCKENGVSMNIAFIVASMMAIKKNVGFRLYAIPINMRDIHDINKNSLGYGIQMKFENSLFLSTKNDNFWERVKKYQANFKLDDVEKNSKEMCHLYEKTYNICDSGNVKLCENSMFVISSIGKMKHLENDLVESIIIGANYQAKMYGGVLFYYLFNDQIYISMAYSNRNNKKIKNVLNDIVITFKKSYDQK